MELIEEKYQRLYNHLFVLYPKNVSLDEDGVIIVTEKGNLFNYDDTEFYGIDIESFELSKIVKRFSDDFYCEWETTYSQRISINI
jgi:hypothetical protein